ncbi:MAG: aminotransferase class IV [Candidatus Paceibacter sp.]|nr:aminotransferase class IV [Candidatus Paceibacter sp.]
MPETKKNNFCYLNGKFLPFTEAGIALDDLGLLRGYGVFDALATLNNGKIFLYDEHYERLKNSSGRLGLNLPLGKEEMRAAITELLRKNNLEKAAVRIVITGGRALDMLYFDPNSPTFFILAKELKPLPKKLFESGAKLITADFGRYMPEIKTLNYQAAVKAFNEGKKTAKDFLEILYVSDGFVLEASTSNFFVFKNDVLITPSEGILKGTTRNLVIKLAKENGFSVEERELSFQEMKTADEAFITSTYKDITPIVQVDDFKIGEGKPGKNTKRLMQIFEEFVRNY